MIKNFLKRYLAVSILALMGVATALACGPWERPHYYVFSAYHRNTMGQVFTPRMNQFWMDYAPVVRDSTYSIGGLSYVEREGFDESKNLIIRAAKSKNDREMLDYLRLLTRYLDICNSLGESWEYPTREELAQRNRDLTYINNRARSYGGTRLAGQYCLLVMRTLMVMGKHNDNIAYWKAHNTKLRASVYKDMMKDIYAGALLNTGHRTEAARIYYELGDMASLRWIMRDNTSLKRLKQEYNSDPNSPILIYLVQELTNVLSDTRYTLIRYKQEGLEENASDIKDFINFAQRVLKEGKTQYPALWQSAVGWLNHSLGNDKESIDQLNKAMKMKGTQRMLDNARVCRFVATAESADASNKTFSFLNEEMQWMVAQETAEEADAECNYCKQNHYTEVLSNVIYDSMAPRYMTSGHTYEALTLLCWMDNHTGDHGDYKCAVDSLSANELVNYKYYMDAAPASNFEAWLRQDGGTLTQDQYNDLEGTKFIREGNFAQAKLFLEKVSLSYLSSQAIAPYAAARNYNKEMCFKLQFGMNRSENLKLSRNIKLDWVSDMLKLMAGYESTQGMEKANIAYRIANLYLQASYKGNCWFISRYGQSVYDTVCYKNEQDFVAEAAQWYQRAIKVDGVPASAKMEYLYAAAWLPYGEPYLTYKYDAEYKLQPVFHRDTYQHDRLGDLNDFALANPSAVKPYVTRCDILKKFRIGK